MISRLARHAFVHYFLLFLGILCIAWSAIFVKLAGISGLGSAFYRMFIGFLGVIPFWMYYRKPIKEWKGVKVALICGFFFACDIALWNTSIMLSKAAVSTLLANLAPVWVGVGAVFFMKEKPKPIFWAGTFVALVGVSIIVGFDNIIYSHLSLGNMLAILASMFYGAYLLTARHGRSSLDTISFTAISMLSSSIVLLAICYFAHTPLGGFSVHSWFALGALGLISQLCGWLAINYSLAYIKPTTASVSLLSQSVFTAIFSVPVLGEFLSWYEAAGAVVVLAGIYMVNRKKRINRASGDK
ncbi:MAG: DMT family transporter [Bacteroidota bacterium]|nr:DMT family transporter [Bacteroidota bacterium]